MKGINIRDVPIDASWAFNNLTQKETNYASHGYHKYPAKFIPQLVKRLLIEYSKKGDTILDPFGGCGTTLVESKLNGRNSISVDVNKSATLISYAKSIPIPPSLLEQANNKLLIKISTNTDNKNYYKNANHRLKYWFKKNQFNKLYKIYSEIQKERDTRLRTFYNCCFSNILKNCSIWLSKSIKPQRDLSKKVITPLDAFTKHLNFMTRQNFDYYKLIKDSKNQKVKSQIILADARQTSLNENMIDLIVTSPPYAISYEYADIHQLSLLWFNFAKDISLVRSSYIGTSSKKYAVDIKTIDSVVGLQIIKSLEKRDKQLANQIASYIVDLNSSFQEMYRVLKYRKRLCMIIGDTQYSGVRIRNTEISIELLTKIGFNVERIIKRRISSKIFTPYRDTKGKFSDNKKGHRKKVYQYEYIIIAKKDSQRETNSISSNSLNN